MWTALENAYRQKKPAQRFNAYEKLFSMQKTDDESFTQFAGRIKASLIDIQALRDSGFTLESLVDELASIALLKGLPTEKYSNFQTHSSSPPNSPCLTWYKLLYLKKQI